MKSSHTVTKAAVHAVFTAIHCYCLPTDLHIKHQQKSLLPYPPKHPTLFHPQQKLPSASSDLKNAFLVGSIYKMQRSEQAKCLYRQMGLSPKSLFLKRQKELSIVQESSVFEVLFMHVCGYFFERTYPAPTVEERKQKEKQRYTAMTQQSFSMNIQQVALIKKKNICDFTQTNDLVADLILVKQLIFHAFGTQER